MAAIDLGSIVSAGVRIEIQIQPLLVMTCCSACQTPTVVRAMLGLKASIAALVSLV